MTNTTLIALNTGLYGRLSAATALTSLLGGTYIYYLQAPENAALPYVVFSHAGGGPVNFPGGLAENLVFVRAYGTTAGQAGSIDAQVDAALATAITVSGATNIWTAREQDTALVETTPAGELIYQSGGIYRVTTDQ